MTDPHEIAAKLTKAHFRFLDDVRNEQELRLADRSEDRIRQKCRRLGLVAWCGKPVRWQISGLGLAVRAILQEKQ